ncbi:MAG: AraC family transcriptional regulator [Chitinophagaceae bacterium]
MSLTAFEYKIVQPPAELSNFVESFWMLQNRTGKDQPVIILPDGRIDIFFSQSAAEPFHATLSGLDSQPGKTNIAAGTHTFAISFKLLAAEYVLKDSVAPLLNHAKHLPTGYWNISSADLKDFDLFCKKVSQQVKSFVNAEIDNRKIDLFNLIYTSKGEATVKEIADTCHWSSRQINRYFNQWFGMSLKTYCDIIRFRASFPHIHQGKLFPELNFTDQSHFIRQIKKYAGVLPKDLSTNKDDRFIQFSTLTDE